MSRCYLFIGPSGSGKTTLADSCFSLEQKIISYTTRPKRSGEKDEVDYHFVSKEVFEEMIQAEAFAEYDRYDHHYYGIAKISIQRALEKGDCYDPITMPGFWNLRRSFGSTVVPVLIDVSKETIHQRLKKRQAPQEEITRRLELFTEEQKRYPELEKLPDLIKIDGEQPLKAMIQQLKQHLC
ncbi:AAA family ATPase [Enterococcus sp. 669A]|uniref:AAA family ATPase n=1 Tax=Candidatus Enterococcus moelleringii TaxID=2815325 RepID=A0ABS3LBP8_9ENTE|nr:AAA family ATPase [Enterococcus sp. 669A]MBO1307059.1 AAA family ATPase [Enterococcus sp. 669A]